MDVSDPSALAGQMMAQEVMVHDRRTKQRSRTYGVLIVGLQRYYRARAKRIRNAKARPRRWWATRRLQVIQRWWRSRMLYLPLHDPGSHASDGLLRRAGAGLLAAGAHRAASPISHEPAPMLSTDNFGRALVAREERRAVLGAAGDNGIVIHPVGSPEECEVVDFQRVHGCHGLLVCGLNNHVG